MSPRLIWGGLIALLIFGAVLVAYLFFKEDIKNLGEDLTNGGVEIPVEKEPQKETLLSSLLFSPIDFDGQMAKLRTKGFENNFFIANVTGVNSQNKKLTLEMSFPTDGQYETEKKVVSANCPIEDTAMITQENMELLEENFDVFNKVAVGDILIAYCLDVSCSLIGKECVLADADSAQ